MYRAVVKLYTLADTNRSRSKNYNGVFTERFNFIFLRIRTVVIRSFRFEFGSTSIYIFICRNNIPFLAFCTNFFYGCVCITSNNRISNRVAFCFTQYFFSNTFFCQCFLHIDNILDFFNKEFVNFCNVVNLLYTDVFTKCFGYNINTFIIYKM